MKHYLMGLLGALTLTACATNDTSYAAKGEYFQPHPDRSEAWNTLSAGIKNTKIRDASAPADAWNDTGAFSYAASGLAGYAMDGVSGAAGFTGLNWLTDQDYPLDMSNVIMWHPADHTQFESEIAQAKAKDEIWNLIYALFEANSKILSVKPHNARSPGEMNQIQYTGELCVTAYERYKSRMIAIGAWSKDTWERNAQGDLICRAYPSVSIVRPVRPNDWRPSNVEASETGYFVATIYLYLWAQGESLFGDLPNASVFVPKGEHSNYLVNDRIRVREVGRGFPYVFTDGNLNVFVRPTSGNQARMSGPEAQSKAPYQY
ncbi:hypothetical protein IC617_08085 [Neiella sp. HB171785]|uniref:Uncharacterized protein n=1 Tax=Neiella litorisoli TaxID=2771431 RepID=A0A8J6QIN2_9GAMM|nr:hypothetical protein [Neiella litorisoli]MBD1389382.1 hypothetical protein [Neiella litorisoli]